MENISQKSGFILIDKPTGITSHDVVDKIRYLTNEKRVGHAGTLDPLATGLLIVGVGRLATKEISKLVGLNKVYSTKIILGAVSNTDDKNGIITNTNNNKKLSLNKITEAIKELTGEILQIPPDYSAVKQKGKKLYEMAREGKKINTKPRAVTIYKFEILNFCKEKNGTYSLFAKIHVSSGTYIRALARDLGKILQIGGYIDELRRTNIGDFQINNAILLNSLKKNEIQKHIIDVDAFLNTLLK